MQFTYPAIFTKHENDEGYHAEFPDLAMCEVDGIDLFSTVEEARTAAFNWITTEIEEFDGDLPFATHKDDIKVKENQMVQLISVMVKMVPDYD